MLPTAQLALLRLNRATSADAAAMLLPCNGSRQWARQMASARPFPDAAALLAASTRIWLRLSPDAQQQAFDAHPRIGERHAKAANSQSLAWSEGEQAAAQQNTDAQATLAEANRAYEAKFRRIFLICATGLSAEQILAALHRRMHNSGEAERAEAAEQQRQITALRLNKWLETPPA